MNPIPSSDRMKNVHSDIRGPVFEKAMKMVSAGIDVLRLNTGNPETFGFTMPDSVRTALMNNVDKAVGYCDLKGMPEARKAICDYHVGKGILDLTMDDIFIGNGVSEVVNMAMTTFLNPGDEILIPSPSYSLWTNMAYIVGATPVLYHCDEASEWYPDVVDIRKKITPQTRAILIINPNNPTGALYSKEVLEQIIQIAREHNLLICSDEIYDRLVMDELEHVSTAALAPDMPVFTFNGLSKSHIVCGFRCGWLAISGPRQQIGGLIASITKLAAMRLCGNALTQLVIPAALADDESTKALISPGGRIYEQREATIKALDQIEGITYVKNAAAFYLFPKIDTPKFNITNDKKFVLDLLENKHILLVAGSGFDWPEPNHFRIVMLPESKVLSNAMQELGDFLNTYRQK
ncbi:aminotransferase [Desulfobacter hydrogenophilus]|uniref:alanine transaminase n=1 Tax=Desulfobacter hydrogenophilus TaxID=2291 RepID=A0A328FGA8_9BACT|nr:aminotransferase class I/II-fold pyridoxal phosphate-dependent enzyme [Desulfobacter hydrogenophilus]NDY71954.1 aminotransferase class I/II-fold pyridoxal phosphate-dependent enzyme [Desulfobacter hydrogenophilus]QBH12354.1 aminotransferase class I/II-fold pyridoxal phosphate-dependent enzyme [Desulfobacter hydrogenophilus]RAM02045.1 aminotransferase [Desulfobacter hydrogenophilus]